MKTIFITASLPMMMRNIFDSGLAHELGKDHQVIILAINNDHTESWLEGCPATIKILNNPYRTNRLQKLLLSAYYLVARDKVQRAFPDLDNLTVVSEAIRRQSSLKYWARRAMALLGRVLPLRRRLFKRFVEHSWDRPHLEKLFDQYSPSCLVATHPMLELDWPIMALAREKGVPITGVVHSWDNPTSKIVMPVEPDQVLTWSGFMTRQMEHYHPYLAGRVHETGSPIHDVYVRELAARQNSGANPSGSKPRLLYCGMGQASYDFDVVRFLIEAREQGRFGKDLDIFVRLYGDAALERFQALERDTPGVVITKASQAFWGACRVEKRWAKSEGLADYVRLLLSADLVVCGASTVTLDAAILDKPVVNVAFDSPGGQNFFSSVRRFYFAYAHYQNVTVSGGAKIALDYGELVAHINAYLEDPGRNRAERRDLAAKLCGRLDGQAVRRMSEAIRRLAPAAR